MKAARRRQRGVALLLLIAIIAIGGTWYMVSRLNQMSANHVAVDRARNAVDAMWRRLRFVASACDASVASKDADAATASGDLRPFAEARHRLRMEWRRRALVRECPASDRSVRAQGVAERIADREMHDVAKTLDARRLDAPAVPALVEA